MIFFAKKIIKIKQSIWFVHFQLRLLIPSILELIISSRASDYGLVKIDNMGRIAQFAEKPSGANLKAMVSTNTKQIIFLHLGFCWFIILFTYISIIIT